jgi:hypothetical protein
MAEQRRWRAEEVESRGRGEQRTWRAEDVESRGRGEQRTWRAEDVESRGRGEQRMEISSSDIRSSSSIRGIRRAVCHGGKGRDEEKKEVRGSGPVTVLHFEHHSREAVI